MNKKEFEMQMFLRDIPVIMRNTEGEIIFLVKEHAIHSLPLRVSVWLPTKHKAYYYSRTEALGFVDGLLS